MLTGRRAFDGATTSEVLARVLEREPDFDALPVDTPPSVVRLLRRTLAKDIRDRLRDMGDARLELADALHHRCRRSDRGHRDDCARSRVRSRRAEWLASACLRPGGARTAPSLRAR
jgi:hypothetical protein